MFLEPSGLNSSQTPVRLELKSENRGNLYGVIIATARWISYVLLAR
jgi:hypothetical protein